MTKKLRVWLDDERPMPEGFDIHVKTAAETITLLEEEVVALISLDDDFRDEDGGTGYDVAEFIEQGAYHRTLDPVHVIFHKTNPDGCERIKQALANADKYWFDRR